jgi:RTX calcium-binding nonapeptide repeat (4 copies)
MRFANGIRLLVAALASVLACAVLVPGVAGATPRVEISGSEITLTGDAEDNEMVVFQPAPGILRFKEEREGLLIAGDGCAGVAPDPPEILVDCPFGAENSLRASLAGGDDSARIDPESAPREVVISGGSGDDRLHSTAAARLIGSSGNDVLEGSAFDDVLAGGLGSDQIVGGFGDDTASYADGRTSGVTADLAGSLANDGNAFDEDDDGGRDNIDDTVENLQGGPGNDTLTGNGSSNLLNGGDGIDELHGDNGADELDGGDMGDVLEGGGGIDRANYSARTDPVVVTIDAVRNDGNSVDGLLASQRDNVLLSVESVTGGAGNDRLSGNFDVNELEGGPGSDRLDGGGAADRLDGGPGGADVVSYASRSEPIEASLDGLPGDGGQTDGSGDLIVSGVEGLEGGSGPDLLTGGAGPNSLNGRGGDDELRARDELGDLALLCGAGSDLVVADIADPVDADCETVERPDLPAPPPGPAPPAGPPAPPAPPSGGGLPAGDLTAPRLSRASIRRKRLRFRLSERARVVVRVERLSARRRARTVARLGLAGSPGLNSVRLGGRLPVGRYRLTLAATDGAGNRSRPLSLKVRLR